MYFIYVLKSLNHNKFYIGQTNDMDRRLGEHNAGNNIYTKRYTPWEIAYYETFKTKKEAIKREKYFKSAAGRRWLKNR